MTTIPERLAEERRRLGLSQEAIAIAAGVQRRAQINYEAGKRAPTVEYLAGVAAGGVDVAYVLTGVRSVAKPGATADDIARMNQLIDDFFALPRDDQDKVLAWTSGLVLAAVDRGEAIGIRRRSSHPVTIHEGPAVPYKTGAQ